MNSFVNPSRENSPPNISLYEDLYEDEGTNISGHEIQTGGMNIHFWGNSCKYTFNTCPTKNDLKEIWRIYQSHISQQRSIAKSLSERLFCMREVLEAPNYDYSEIREELNNIEDNPEECLELALKLRSLIKQYVLTQVRETQQFKINNHEFQVGSDEAGKNVIHIFKDLFNYYFEIKDWKNAFIVLAKIKHTTFGRQGYIRLASHCLTQDSRRYFNQEYKKMAAFCLSQGDVLSALKIIRGIYEDRIRNEEYIKIVVYYVSRKEIYKALEIIALINDGYTRNEEYKNIIEYYITYKINLADALIIIPLVKDRYARDQKYVKIVDLQIASGNIEDAKKTAQLIQDPHMKRQQQAKFFILVN